MVDDVIADSLGLTMEHHDRLGKDSLLALDLLLSKSEVLHLGISVVERALQKDKLLIESLLLSLFTLVSLLNSLNILAEGVKFVMELL